MSARDEDTRTDRVLAKVYRRAGSVLAPAPLATPLDVLIQKEEDEGHDDPDLFSAHRDGVNRFLLWLLEGGPDPRKVTLRLFSYIRMLHPEWLMNMNQSDLAAAFGQGRAAQSSREKKMERELRKRGEYRQPIVLPGQKSLTACRKYAVRAKGNHHRRDSVKERAA